MSLSLQETESWLHTAIPITQALQIHLESYNETGLILTAPLAPNHNHLGTAFGGSLAAAATLTGYTLLWLELDDRTCHIVIQESHLRYLAPVRQDIRAHTHRLTPEALHTFRTTYQRTGKARLSLPVTITSEGKTAVEFTGTFVALR